MHDNQKSTSMTDLQDEVAKLMVECLNLEVTANQISPDAPLYGDGLIFGSLHNLCDYIAAHRTL